MKLHYDDTALEVSSNGRLFAVTLDGQTFHAELLHAEEGKLELLVEGKRVTAYVSSENSRRWVTVHGHTFLLTKSSGARASGHGHSHTAGGLTAPMPGQVRAVNVGEGERVTKGQTLMVLEAMKMEIRIHAPSDGIVKNLFVQQGQTVEREQIMIEIEEN